MDRITVIFLTRHSRRPRQVFGGLGSILLLSGSGIGTCFTILRIQGEQIGTRPLMLLGALIILIGIQMLSMGLLAEMLAGALSDPDYFSAREQI